MGRHCSQRENSANLGVKGLISVMRVNFSFLGKVSIAVLAVCLTFISSKSKKFMLFSSKKLISCGLSNNFDSRTGCFAAFDICEFLNYK